jgi:hypothetical protein
MTRAVDRVGRARFRISSADQGALLNWRTQLQGSSDELEAALERAFSGLTTPHEVLVIDRLEVDLGTLTPDDLDLDGLVKATRAALERAATTAPLRRDLPPVRAAPSGEALASTTPYRVALPHSAAAALIVYLATGNLPPDTPVTTLSALYTVLTPDAPTTTTALARFLIRATKRSRRAALMRILASAPPALARTLVTMAFADLPGIVAAMDTSDSLGKSTGASRLTGAGRLKVTATAEAVAGEIESHQSDTAVDEISSPPAQTLTEDESLALPCANAGLVLLHPFLKPYFSGIGLLGQDDFLNDAARVTAVRLLHAIATGEIQADEPDLTLPRLLCAVPGDLPVLPLAPLDPEHLDEGKRMLDAFLAAWEGIGHATPEGIRASFLRRPGMLDGPTDAPRLTMERSGIDILLSRLPWALSVIRLPWMPAPLKVDWT